MNHFEHFVVLIYVDIISKRSIANYNEDNTSKLLFRAVFSFSKTVSQYSHYNIYFVFKSNLKIMRYPGTNQIHEDCCSFEKSIIRGIFIVSA